MGKKVKKVVKPFDFYALRQPTPDGLSETIHSIWKTESDALYYAKTHFEKYESYEVTGEYFERQL